MDKLKPCPFCGKTPVTVVDDETEKKFGVKCFSCGGAIYPEKETLDEAIEAWNRRVTIEPEQQWISCSDRLPDVSGRYLVTRGLKAAGAIWNRVYIANFSDLMGLKPNMIFWQGNVGKSDFERLDDVLAWMPLPKPYKEENR